MKRLALATGFGLGGIIADAVNPEFRHEVPVIAPVAEGSDEFWMREALRVAMKAGGLPSPNPAVGCVLVAEGKKIAEGWTEPFGGKHAERVAVESARATVEPSLITEATAYVTLEPCSHFGKQPPCADLLIEAGIRRVVVAAGDPHHLVNGEGIERLLAAGIEIKLGVLGPEASAWHFPFLETVGLDRPLFIGKWAQSLDGKLCDFEGSSRWISGAAARSYSHWLRRKYDAVLVGAGTVLADFPRLDVRDCPGADSRRPLRIVWDPRGRCLAAARESLELRERLGRSVFSSESSPWLYLHGLQDENGARRDMELFFKSGLCIGVGSDSGVPALKRALVSPEVREWRGDVPLQSVMVEGGPVLLGALITAGALDAVHIFIAPFWLGAGRGGGESSSLVLSRAESWARLQSCPIGGSDTLIEAVRELRKI